MSEKQATTDIHENTSKWTLSTLLSSPKGELRYKKDQMFLLHVFWYCPSYHLAKQLLSSLNICGEATHENTPCVPTYFFRISHNDASLASRSPKLISEHPQIMIARNKIIRGVPKQAVYNDLIRQGLSSSLAQTLTDPAITKETDPLPKELLYESDSCIVEFTELYGDELSFYQHSGSKKYLNAYASIMDPKLQSDKPITLRLGTPTSGISEKILEPMLNEKVQMLKPGCFLYRKPESNNSSFRSDESSLLSMDLTYKELIDSNVSNDNKDKSSELNFTDFTNEPELCGCTSFIVMDHPLKKNVFRLIAVFPALPSVQTLSLLKQTIISKNNLNILQGEIYYNYFFSSSNQPSQSESSLSTFHNNLVSNLDKSELSFIRVNPRNTKGTGNDNSEYAILDSLGVGYILHQQADKLIPI